MLCMSEEFGKGSLGKKLCLSSLQQNISGYIFSVTYKALSALPPLVGNTTAVVLANKKKNAFGSHMYGKLFGRNYQDYELWTTSLFF